jgi:hypothetical protein
VRLFVTPERGGWVRVIGEPDPRLPGLLSRGRAALALTLDGTAAAATVWKDGGETSLDALAPYLRPGRTPGDLARALTAPVALPNALSPSLPLNALPDDVRALADRVSPGKAESLFARLAGTAARRAGQDAADADAARRLIAAGQPADWDSPGGRRLTAFVACLTVPDGWREPAFVALRDAYQLHERRRRSPDAALYPGDAEAMARAPDALDYTPVYAGREA